jgi:hypothetical protein
MSITFRDRDGNRFRMVERDRRSGPAGQVQRTG